MNDNRKVKLKEIKAEIKKDFNRKSGTSLSFVLITFDKVHLLIYHYEEITVIIQKY